MTGTKGVVPRVKVGTFADPVDRRSRRRQFTDRLTTAGSDVWRSTAPRSMRWPLIRGRPRWSTAGVAPKAGLPLSKAGLVGEIMRVCVGPPLLASGPSWGSAVMLLAPLTVPPAVDSDTP